LTARRPPVPILLAFIVALTGLLAACTVNGSVTEIEDQREEFQVGATPIVIVETFNGRISVQLGADGVVAARVMTRGSGTSSETAQRDLQNIAVDFDRFGDRITITARRVDTQGPLNNSGADVEVTVPSASSVELRTSNGRVESANVEGSVLARTSNGPITTRGGRNLDLDTTNGQISVSNPRGRLTLRTSNGAIDVLAADQVRDLSAQTSNFPLTFSGTLAPGAHSLATSNGDIAITLPGDAEFLFDGSTSNGFVRTDFADLTYTDTTLTGHTGTDPTPLVSITARTSNGDLAVMMQRP
jgi:hypothetical protein